jgi:uncharacterized membrane protein YphA (DoxX/SURF4 family)
MVRGVSTLIASDGSSAVVPWVIGLLEILVGVALLIGFLTPIAGGSAALGNLTIGISWVLTANANANERLFTAILVLMSAALVLLGPGAFSLDAYLFGRREIIIPEVSRPPEL